MKRARFFINFVCMKASCCEPLMSRTDVLTRQPKLKAQAAVAWTVAQKRVPSSRLHLLSEIERFAKQRMCTPRDFLRLSRSVGERTGQSISPSTLKRLWGYMKDGGEPRVSTLKVLARYLGYSDFDSFAQGEANPSSLILGQHSVDADQLEQGDELRLTWPPNRSITIRHLGNAEFTIVEAENTKLSVGDTFACHLFISGEPLYLSNLIHHSSAPTGYVAGKKNGITIVRCS